MPKKCCCTSGSCAADSSHGLYLGADPTLVTFDVQFADFADGLPLIDGECGTTAACKDMTQLNSSQTLTHTVSASTITYNWAGTTGAGPPAEKADAKIIIVASAPASLVTSHCDTPDGFTCAYLQTNTAASGGCYWRTTHYWQDSSSSWVFCLFENIGGCKTPSPTPSLVSFTKNLNQ